MSKRVIRVGDTTNHGGRVLASGALHFTVNGIPMSLVGDPCTCPKKDHKHCKIAASDAGHPIGSVAIASEGCLTTCGATLVATMPNFATARPGIQRQNCTTSVGKCLRFKMRRARSRKTRQFAKSIFLTQRTKIRRQFSRGNV